MNYLTAPLWRPLWRLIRLALLCALCAYMPAHGRQETLPAIDSIALAALPPEARATLTLIERGGPFPYSRDGLVFQNRERRLPFKPRGYYREYTVPTPSARDRGARRIVTGGGAEVFYYTADHYRSFHRIDK